MIKTLPLFDLSQFTRPIPFLKWAGGKRQLLSVIMPLINRTSFTTYIEPFVGAGAVMFELLSRSKPPSKITINDKNHRLTNCYQVIKNLPDKLIVRLEQLQEEYWQLPTLPDKKVMYEHKRDAFNSNEIDNIEQAALFIFLNRTGYNGLYRENGKGEFNNSFGGKEYPKILFEEVILACNRTLQNVGILNQDFDSIPINKTNLYYLDPPYQPVNDNPHGYTSDGFYWDDQVRVREYCDRLTAAGANFILSNSYCPEILDLYQGYSLKKVLAKRNIASKGIVRSERCPEVLVTNF